MSLLSIKYTYKIFSNIPNDNDHITFTYILFSQFLFIIFEISLVQEWIKQL